MGTTAELDGSVPGQTTPALEATVKGALATDDLVRARDKLAELGGIAAEDQTAAVLRGGQAQEEIRFTTARGAAVEQLVSGTAIGQFLRRGQRSP
jgi:hypothetical protein